MMIYGEAGQGRVGWLKYKQLFCRVLLINRMGQSSRRKD